VTVTEAAAALNVSTSNAHRLLSALAHRDFATRDEHHRYLAGPALSLRTGVVLPASALTRRYLPLMRSLATEVDETVSLGVRVVTRMRVLATIQAARMLRVGDQEGTVLPAHLTAIGKVLLAPLSDDRLYSLYRSTDTSGISLTSTELTRLRRELEAVRRVGFAVNHGEAESGVSAIGIPLTDGSGRVSAGLAVAMPSSRFNSAAVERIVRVMSRLVSDIANGP